MSIFSSCPADKQNWKESHLKVAKIKEQKEGFFAVLNPPKCIANFQTLPMHFKWDFYELSNSKGNKEDRNTQGMSWLSISIWSWYRVRMVLLGSVKILPYRLSK